MNHSAQFITCFYHWPVQEPLLSYLVIHLYAHFSLLLSSEKNFPDFLYVYVFLQNRWCYF